LRGNSVEAPSRGNSRMGGAMNTRTAILCLPMTVTAWAQATPDFSGTWKLNIDDTEFPAARPSPATFSVVRTVEQKRTELRLKIERVNNGRKSGFDFVTIPIGGGPPHESDEAGIISAEWKGATLHFTYLYNPGTARQSERTEDWTLSPDGKKLIDQEWTKRPDGPELRYKVVFDRQP
jgi:hypothetical protein